MSVFGELLPKINEIPISYTKNFNDDLKAALECFDKFEEEFLNGRSRAREKTQKSKSSKVLTSIHEDEAEPKKISDPDIAAQNSREHSEAESPPSNAERRRSKKRSKNEMEGTSSPEQDKRQKRNASVKAQGIISKQVNVNLTQKMRRETSNDNVDKDQSTRSRRHKNHEKENLEPNSLPLIQVKQEKISIPAETEPMDAESTLPIHIEVKPEPNIDDIAMPPPLAPIPKTRKAIPKDKSQMDETSEEEPQGRSRRVRKQTDTMPPPPVPAERSTRSSRASSRARQPETEEPLPPPAAAEARPKRTRAKKIQSDVSTVDADSNVTQSVDSIPTSPENPRPKRTRRGQKAAEKKQPQPVEPDSTQISPKAEKISEPTISSPILQKEIKTRNKKGKNNQDGDLHIEIGPSTSNSTVELDKTNNLPKGLTKTNSTEKASTQSDSTETEKTKNAEKNLAKTKKGTAKCGETEMDQVDSLALDDTKIITKPSEMDQTVVLPNGVFNHNPVTPKNICHMNATVVLERLNNETILLDKPQHVIMDSTVVIDKGPSSTNMTADDSLLTDDSEIENTPPKKDIPSTQPTSAVKEKVQQFEEMATRVTRTKTRALAKKEEDPETLTTPPDKISKAVLSAETLTKMNNLIFNGKVPQMSNSASKPRVNTVPLKHQPASTSKLSAINKAKEAAEESLKREDARKKKEAMLEAKRELQKKKREEKMAAAAAAREAAERDRRLAMEAAAKERMEKQAHADQGKMERLKEAERKKHELARKAAETEERRKAEEAARQQRLAEEQRKAMAQRRKQQEEQEAMKREAAIMAKEIEQKQREYIEKQKKQKVENKTHTPFKIPNTPTPYSNGQMDPVYMQDGFQFLNSDEDSSPPRRPIPSWSSSKSRKERLWVQAHVGVVHVDRLFSVRVHSPNLAELFPNIERARLKRTSSAVWRTPPNLKGNH